MRLYIKKYDRQHIRIIDIRMNVANHKRFVLILIKVRTMIVAAKDSIGKPKRLINIAKISVLQLHLIIENSPFHSLSFVRQFQLHLEQNLIIITLMF